MALELMLLYRITRHTGISLGTLHSMDAVEVEVMMAIEEARSQHYLRRLQAMSGAKKQAEALSAEVAVLNSEWEFLM
jgi:hypothetical protein